MVDHADRFIQWKLLQEGTAMTIYVNLFILSIVQLLAASLRIFFLFPLASTAKRKKDLAQDQNIPTAIFEVFKNQNMTLSSVSILNGIVFFL